jgi:hypothetical protein
MNRWAKAGVLDRLFAELQREQLIRIKIEAVSLDSTIIKVHPDSTGALKKTDGKPSANAAAVGAPEFIWLPRVIDAPWVSRFPLGRPGMLRRGRALLRSIRGMSAPQSAIEMQNEIALVRRLAMLLGSI